MQLLPDGLAPIRDDTDSLMSTTHRNVLALLVATVALLLGASACQVVDEEAPNRNSADEPETIQQGIGESYNGYRIDGNGSGTLPKRNERVAHHLINRFRINPFDEFELTDMNDNPIPANPLARYSHVGSEGARWKARYMLNNECDSPCDHDNNMMTPPVWRTCCQIAVQDGKFTCTPPDEVACSSDQAMTQDERLGLFSQTGVPSFAGDFWSGQSLNPDQIVDGFPGDLATGYPGELAVLQNAQNLIRTATNPGSETLGIGYVNQPDLPDSCDPEPPTACSRGTCTNSEGGEFCNPDENPECAGTCRGSECDGRCTNDDGNPLPCELPEEPDPEECAPANNPRAYQFSFNRGSTPLPIPTLLGGIHLKLGFYSDDSPFGTTPPEDIEFAIHYYEPSAPAEDAKVVVDGQCNELETRFEPESAPVGTPDAGGDTEQPEFDYQGLTYNTEIELGAGCHPYYFSFIDGEGFVQTYPEYGALQARILQGQTEDGGTINLPLPNNESCPIWTPDRPNANAACLPAANECDDGETRGCYTGRAETRGVGACSVGVESCENGRWTGVCENQTLPAEDETCGDGVDNDCNGRVDDGCDSGGDAGNGGGSDDTGTTADAGMTDGGSSLTPSDDSGDSGCGCASTGDSVPLAPLAAMVLLLGAGRLQRRDR